MIPIVESAKETARRTISKIGRDGLHAMAPNDFELYACSFELLDSSGNIEQIFNFPVMPTGISIDGQSLVNINKTGRGMFVQFSDSFTPKTISINGTFGRKFRLLLSTHDFDKITDVNDIKQYIKNIDLKVKTGYGSMKLMESILDKLYQLDKSGNPRYLIYHNRAFSQSYVVEVISKNFSQSTENNMMWNYSIQLKSVADASKLNISTNSKRTLKDDLTIGVVKGAIYRIFQKIN